MDSFTQVLVVVLTAILAGAVAQYNDGYQIVDSATDPVQIRLAYQGPTAMMVSWNTFAQLTNPTVAYGLSPDALIQTASSSVSVTYPTSLTYNNHVNLTGLLPYTTYYYLPQYSNASTPYTFTTARAAGDPTPYTVGVVVDMGTFGALGLSDVTGTGASNPLRVNEQTTISALEEMIDNYEFMVQAGDLAYADYWLKEEIQNYLPTTTTAQGAQVYESILNAFYDELINITSAKAYMVNAGNHEANCDNGGTTNKTSGVAYTESICLPGQTNFTGYINHWRMPSGPSGGLGNFWYSYDYGMVHFVHIDTETDLGNGLIGPDENSPEYAGPFGSHNQQIDWLTNDLASVNRTVTPWIVVFGHRGWYLSASGSVCPNCQTAFEGLLHEYDVDLYINGHAHLYERTAPIYNNVIDPNGLSNPRSTLYVTNGAAGHYDGLDSFTAIQPYSVYRQGSDYSWTTISFTNATHMTVSSLWSANNTVFDSATLYKAHVYSTNSSSSSTSSMSTTPSTTTNTATPTNTIAYPTYTNFNGQGHLYVYTGGLNEGDVGSADTWYNTPGQNTTTYTAVPLYSNGTAFTLQHSSDYCAIGPDSSFGCGVESTDATIFGQTLDGNLTYNGSPAFYASSSASSGAKPTIYATPLPVAMNIVWGVNGPPLPASTTSTSVSSSTTSSTTTSAASATSTSESSSSVTSSSGTVVTSGSLIVATTTFVTVTSTETDSATITLTSTVTDSTTITETDSVAITVTETNSPVTVTSTLPASTVTVTQPSSTVTITQPASTVTLTAKTITKYITATITKTLTQTTVSRTTTVAIDTVTDIIRSTILSTSTITDIIRSTLVSTSTTTKFKTATATATITSTTTITSTATETKKP